MRTRTLTDMISDVRLRTNQENSTFVTDPEITEYLNQELAELWAHITQSSGQPHYRASTTVSVTSATSLYAVPADFWQLQNVEATINGLTGDLDPFMPGEHAYLSNPGVWGSVSPVRYRLQAGNIEFLPNSQSFTATIYYTPSCPRLTTGTDTFDGFGGFEVAAIFGACATVLAKEESDPSFYISEKERRYRLIDSLAAQRDAGHPERVQDVTGESAWPGRMFGWWV